MSRWADLSSGKSWNKSSISAPVVSIASLSHGVSIEEGALSIVGDGNGSVIGADKEGDSSQEPVVDGTTVELEVEESDWPPGRDRLRAGLDDVTRELNRSELRSLGFR